MITTLIAGALTLAAAQTAPRPARDAGAVTTPSGTGVIAGTILLDATERRPLRRVRVTINSSDREVGRTAITDDEGAFLFTDLPPARYTLAATRPGFVTMNYGAARPARPGTPIALADGQRVSGLTLKLPRGGVITGTVTDHNGNPASGVTVTALRAAVVSGERRFVYAGRGVETDDRGTYRIFELAGGDYVVATGGRGSPSSGEEMALMTPEDIRSAVASLTAARPGTSAPRDRDAAAAAAPRTTVGNAPVFYPGTTSPAQAGTVSVAAGEERGGVDFQLQLVPTAKVEGTVLMPDSTPMPAGTVVNLMATGPAFGGITMETLKFSRTDAEGHFYFSGIAPGAYTVLSRAAPPSAAATPAAPARPLDSRVPPYWAKADVTVEGQNVSGLSLMLQPGLTVSGRIQIDGSTLPPPALNRLRVGLASAQGQGEITLGTSAATADADGRFAITGVTPGRYRLTATVPGQRPDSPGWSMQSATLDGQDALDLPIAINRSVENAVVVLSDRTTELSGTVTDGSGEPAPDNFIIVFAADKAFWTPQSRRTQSVRPSAAGKFVVRNLPAGDYLLAAVADVEPGEWQDPAFLQRIAPMAIKFTLADGEKKIQDVRLREP